jgi:hypothetical protein
MKHWWCMGCETQVKLDKHGQCDTCGSEAVDFLSETTDVSPSVSAGNCDLKTALTGLGA